MIKKIGCAVIAILLVLLLIGCTSNDAVVQQEMFASVENGTSWIVVYHKETKVMYVVSMSSYNCGNFTLLVNADGTPMLWEDAESQ